MSSTILAAGFAPGLLLHAQQWTMLRKYTTHDGLSQNYVNCGFQDSKGIIWLGTRYGLNRFDGYGFLAYHHAPDDSATLSDDEITAIVEDSSGLLWIGTKNGLNRYHRRVDRFTRQRFHTIDGRELPDPAITALLFDRDGNLWIGTLHGAFFLRKGDAVAHEIGGPWVSRTRRTRALAMQLTGRGELLLSIDEYLVLASYDAGGVRTHILDYRKGTVHSMAQLSGGRWLLNCNNDTSFSILLSSSWRRHNVPSLVQSSGMPLSIRQFYRTRSGILLASANNGIFRIDSVTAGPRLRIHAQLLQSGIGLSAFEDAQNNLWLGTTNGVIVLSPRRSAFTTGQFFPGSDAGGMDNTVRSFHSDDDGTILAGSIYGLHEISGKHRFISLCNTHVQPVRNHAFRDAVNSIFRAADGSLLLAGLGIYRHTQMTTGTRQQLHNGIHATWCLFEEKPGRLWAGTTWAGIFVFDRRFDELAHYMHDPENPRSISSGMIHSIMRDRQQRIWVATNDGLNRWNPTDRSFIRYRYDPANAHSIGDNRVWVLHEDRQGRIWVGTYGGGLAKYRPETDDFVRITERDGLPSNAVFGIVEDARGRFWITTEAGLVCFDPARATWREYNETDRPQFRDFGFNAYHMTPSGEILFGGSAGWIRFHPDSVRWNTDAPRIMITGVWLFERRLRAELQHGDTVEARYADNMLRFDFAALDYTQPEKNRFAYMLEGFNKTWIHTGARHTATFTNLDPGSYVLRVRGANPDGVWNTADYAVVLRIVPPIHMTWWFRSLMALLFLALLVSFAYVRINGIRRKERMRRRLAESELSVLRLQMNPHFIFNSLNAVQSYLLTADQNLANSYLTKFARLMRTILEYSRLRSITLADEIEFLALYVQLENMRFVGRIRYHCRVDPEIDTAWRIPSMLLQPFVENAIRHGLAHLERSGNLHVSFVRDGDMLRCTVEDDGIGRARSAHIRERAGKRSSLGITVTRERLELLAGASDGSQRLSITDLFDAEGNSAGTRIEIIFPFETVVES